MFSLCLQEQLEESIGEEETALASLSRKQYDALRRLRSYWVPRFLIHYQRIRQLRFVLGWITVLLELGYRHR